jgi:hypothetical protein
MWNYVAEYKGIRCNLVDEDTILTTNDASALTLGFEKKVMDDGYVYYRLPITPDLLENAYKSECYGEYNGDVLECEYSKERRTFSVHLGENEELCRRYGIGDVYDRYIGSRGYECFNDLWIVVPEDEVLDVWEQRSPIKEFQFHGPEKVYVRKDGVWLR